MVKAQANRTTALPHSTYLQQQEAEALHKGGVLCEKVLLAHILELLGGQPVVDMAFGHIHTRERRYVSGQAQQNRSTKQLLAR